MLEELKPKWEKINIYIENTFGKKPDVNAILFLIGARELGISKAKFTKEEKVSLMHIAVCKLLSQDGYYELEGLDKDGWPHWKLIKKLPFVDVFQQEIYLKKLIADYFENEQIIAF